MFGGAAAPPSSFFAPNNAPAAVNFGSNAAPKTSSGPTNLPQSGTGGFPSFGTASVPASEFTGFNLTKSASQVALTATQPQLQQQQPQKQQQQQQQPQKLQQQQQHDMVSQAQNEKAKDLNKPLYTMPPTYVPPVATNGTENVQLSMAKNEKTVATKSQMNEDDITEVVRQMLNVQLLAFDAELQHLSRAFTTNISGNLDEVKQYTRRLNDLQEIIEQANDREFEQDVQNLRHALNDSYAMVAEFRSKLDLYNNPDLTPLANMTNFDAINRRQLSKLQSYLANNEAQLQQLQLQIDTQWSNFQDLLRRNSKSKMHIPCLDGIYQRMTKLKDVVARQRTRLNCIRSKLKQQGFYYKQNGTEAPAEAENTIDSLTDSVLSLSIAQSVQESRAKLSTQKLQGIRQALRQRQSILHIKPQRPDRENLKSEVILETKLRSEQRSQRERRDGATTNLNKMLQQQEPPQQQPKQAAPVVSTSAALNFGGDAGPTLAKPTATKALPATSSFVTPVSNAAPMFSFGATSPFVKTSSATAVSVARSEAEATLSKPFAGFNFSLPKGTSIAPIVPEAPNAAAQPAPTPISFAAKVIGGDAAKVTTAQPIFKPDVAVSGFSALPAPSVAAEAVTLKKPEESKPSEPKADLSKPLFGGFGVVSTTSSAFSFSGFGTPTNSLAATQPVVPKPSFGSLGASLTTTSSGSSLSAKPTSAFSGFGKAIGELATLAATLSGSTTSTTTVTTAPTSALNLTAGTKSSTTTQLTTTTTVTSSVSATKTTPAPVAKAIAENILAGLNTCKPNTKEVAEKADSSEAFKPTFDTGGTSPFSFTNALGLLAKTALASTTAATATTTTAAVTSTTATTAAAPTAATDVSPFADLTAWTVTTTATVFGSNVVTTAAPVTASTTLFSTFSSTPSTPATTAPLTFGTAVATTAVTGVTTGLFGAPITSTTAATTTAIPPPASGTSIFAGIPKPDQSVFGAPSVQPASDLFATAAAQTANSFSSMTTSSTAAAGGSIFGGQVGIGFGASPGGNIFGGGANTAVANTGFGAANAAPATTGSIFGGGTAKPAEGGNLFQTSPQASTAAVSGGSLFAQSPGFGTFSAQPNPTPSSGFGMSGSVFGGAPTNAGASSGSIFGGDKSTGFGGFGSPSAAGSGSFAQGGASVAQTGFGSPPAASAFTKPIFGGSPSFGSPPAFGAQPSFGGAPTFGSPKAFVSFAAPTAQAPQVNQFNVAPQNNNLFEALGSSESALSFGNLAQNTNVNAPKASFGGSSFMNYRA